MPFYRSTREGRRSIALAVASVALASGCLPSTWVARKAPPPPDVAREEQARAAANPLPIAPPAAPSTSAPAPTPAEPRSLSDILELALSRDPSTRAAWYDARAAAAQAGSERSAWLPDLDVSLLLSRQRTGSTINGRPDSKQTTLTPSATLTWLLVDLGVRGALIDAADFTATAARLAEVSAVSNLVLSVQQTYFGYLGARALVEAETATVKQAETSLAAAEARQRAGLATIADVLQARTALSQARLTLQQFQGQALAVRGALATLAGLGPAAELDLGMLPADVSTEAAQPAIDALLAAAESHNPDVASARAAAEAAGARARAAGRAVWPTLSFQSSVFEPFYLSPKGVSESPGWIFGLALRLPLDGLGVKPAYDVLAARAAADAARSRADATSQRVALDAWTGYQGVRTAAGRIATSRDLLDAARANADVAQGRYKEGVGSILDLLNAQAALELAQAESIRARADYLVSLAQLARASGRLDAVSRQPAAAPPAQAPQAPAPGGSPNP